MKKLLLSIMSLMAMNGAMAQTPVGDNDPLMHTLPKR